MIKVQCSCGRSLKAQDADRGRKMKCPGCGQVVVVEAARQETHAGGDTHAERSKASGGSCSSGVPQRLAHYDVVRKLGAGAMGEVFLGRDRMLERDVAIKVLPRELAADQTRLDRFVREAQAAARLNHAHAVTVYQVGVEQGLPFLVMEVMDGGSLADSIAETGPMEWRAATKAIRDAAAGLAAAHEAGLVHRDIKPANLMRNSKGIVKVADFGLARSQAQATHLTQTGTVIGTPAFMAPEQWRGGEPDPRSDLYALACTYYALLTGRPPFEAPTLPAVMYQHMTQPPPDPRQYMQRLPDGVCAILARGAQKEPSARYQSADELIHDLEALLSATPQTLTYRADWKSQFTQSPAGTPGGASIAPSKDAARSDAGDAVWWRRPRVLIGGGIGIAGAILLLIGVAVGLGGRGQPESGQSIAAVPPSVESNATVPTSVPPVAPDNATASSPPAPNGDNSMIAMPGSAGSFAGGPSPGGGFPGGPGANPSAGLSFGGGAFAPSSSNGGLLSGGAAGLGPGGNAVESAPMETETTPANRYPGWSALQAIGPPDVPAEDSDATEPSYGDSPAVSAGPGGLGGFGGPRPSRMQGGPSSTTSRFEAAWQPNGLGSTDEWLLVEFSAAAKPKAVRVHVANGPGALFKLSAQRPDGIEAPLWVGSDPSPRGEGAAVSELPASAEFPTRRLRLHLDPTIATDFTAIDAIELVAEDDTRQWAVAAASSTAMQEMIPRPGGGAANDPLAIPGLATRIANVEERLTELSEAVPPPNQDPLEAAWIRARWADRYRMLLGQFHRPDDREEWGDFKNLGIRDGRPPIVDADAPDGAYWVYAAPYWYAWQRLKEKSPPAPSCGAEQAIGMPDTPHQQFAETAWTPTADSEGDRWLMVEYEKPIAAKRLKVYESMNPGAVTRVMAFQLDGTEVRAWFGRDPTAPKKPTRKPKSKGDSGVSFADGTTPAAVAELPLSAFKGRITRLRLFVDPSKFAGNTPGSVDQPQIDAVELIDADGQSHWPVSAVASGSADSSGSDDGLISGLSGAGPATMTPSGGLGSPRNADETSSDLTTSTSVDDVLSRLELQWVELLPRLPAGVTVAEPQTTTANLHELRLLRLESAIEQASGASPP